MADPPWTDIGLGLGGNIGNVSETLRRALDMLVARGHVRVSRVSSLYATKPWGPVTQPDFVNLCALGSTDLDPQALLAEVKAVETALGRTNSVRWGPRAIDIDILFVEGVSVQDSDLVIPHESLFQRAFVLIPLAEIAPDLAIAGRSVAAAAAAIDPADIRLLPPA